MTRRNFTGFSGQGPCEKLPRPPTHCFHQSLLFIRNMILHWKSQHSTRGRTYSCWTINICPSWWNSKGLWKTAKATPSSFCQLLFFIKNTEFLHWKSQDSTRSEPIWMINICPWWWNSRYTFLESDSEICVSESQIPASADLRAVHTKLKRYTFLEWGSEMSISESQIPISANCRLSIVHNFRFQNHSIKFHPNTISLMARWSLEFGPTLCTRKHCQKIWTSTLRRIRVELAT